MSFPTRVAREAVSHVANALVSVVLAPTCAACGHVLARPSEGAICARCWATVVRLTPPLCQSCGSMLPSWRVIDESTERCASCRRRTQSTVDACRAGGRYEGSLRQIVHAFKYEGRRTLASTLGALMREAGRDLFDDAACVVPVPLHPWRRFQRGFNQAADLARMMPLPVVHALWRRRMTTAQPGLTASARRRNVRGAFRLSPFISNRVVRSLLVDRVVVLVDDVRTTGATLEVCAGVLKEAGAHEVRALTAARADQSHAARSTM